MALLLHRVSARIVACLLIAGIAAPADAACTPPHTPDTGVALILSGGGAKGAWEAGVASTLIERGARVRLVAGSSSGALNAAMITDGRLDRLEATWRTITRDRVYALRPAVFFAGLLPGWLTLLSVGSARSLFDPAPLRELISTSVDLDRVRRSDIRLLVVTTDLTRGARRVFDNATVTVDALMAAAAVPGAFPPVELDGSALVDGGVTGRAPVLDALESGIPVERVLVVMGFTPRERRSTPGSIRASLEAAFEIAMITQIERDAELARLRYPAIDLQILAPSTPLQLRPQDFDSLRTARAFELGKRDGATCADVWQSPTR